jgi:hypothetical protein
VKRTVLFLAVVGVFAPSALLSAFAGETVLQDDWWSVAFDNDTGALTRLENKALHWTIGQRPELGVSFRLHAPLPGRRDNFVLGPKQRAAEIKTISQRQAAFRWQNLASEHGGALPMTFTATVTLSNGALVFDAALKNDSPLMVETIDYPYLGELNPPAPGATLRTRHEWYGNLASGEIYPTFANAKGYWGVDFPTRTIDSRESLFCLIEAPEKGLYVGMHDGAQPYLLQFTFEEHPGVVESVNNRVPQGADISGLPAHLEFRACHFPFARPHSSVSLAPVVLRGYGGDWHAGVEAYKQWRAAWFKPARFPAWVEDVNSWQQLQINSPEQEYRVPYTHLIQYGEECAANGVAAIQLVGWNIGGQDGGDPSQDTDPGLGTRQELRDAIAQIQAKGVKMILFAKLNWADMTTAWFTNELYQYAATDPFGIPYEQGGYSYHTPTQLAGINNHRRRVMDFACPACRDLAAKEFEKLLGLGAAGWLWDEVCHHGGINYSFAAGHGYTPPGYLYAGDIPLARQLRAAADRTDPDFLFSGEGPQDWLTPYYASYFRINGASTPVGRYLDPRAPMIVAVTGVDDREKLNLILLGRYIISYEPYNFKGHLTDFPLTLAYGQKIDALRRRYKAYLWDAEFRDTLGAKVTGEGPRRYSVFAASSGRRAVVVVNDNFSKPITARVELPNPGRLVVATPEEPDAKPATGEVRIPPRSAAVLMEE